MWVASLVTVYMKYSQCPEWVACLVTVYMKYSKPPLSQFISDKYMKCSKFPEWVASLVTVFMMYSKCPDWVASLVTVYMNSLTKDDALYMIYWIQWEILFGSSFKWIKYWLSFVYSWVLWCTHSVTSFFWLWIMGKKTLLSDWPILGQIYLGKNV